MCCKTAEMTPFKLKMQAVGTAYSEATRLSIFLLLAMFHGPSQWNSALAETLVAKLVELEQIEAAEIDN